jgi:hypothetical protein
MLHQMCHGVLSQADIKAICKARDLPAQAVTSPSVLETLFVTDRGLSTVFETLEPQEIVQLHRLRAFDKPVDVTFFACLQRTRVHRLQFGTFTQRYQEVFKLVKEHFVRKGIVLIAKDPRVWSNKSQMELWLFSLPTEFHAHLPPLITSVKHLSGPGESRHDVPRGKLKTAVGHKSLNKQTVDVLQIADRELRWNGNPFRACELSNWQKRSWQADSQPKKEKKNHRTDKYALSPVDAIVQILGTLEENAWASAASLAPPLEVFCGASIDSQQLCDSGYCWGCLARQQAEGVTWYRLAMPPPATSVPPHQYLKLASDGTVTVDLETVPLESLEQLVAISDQQPGPSGRPVLLLAPNLIKLGRMLGVLQSMPPAEWLQNNSVEFQQAFDTCRQRSGRTILHENLAVARVSDLALKVAIEKSLGGSIVSLGEEYLAFPYGLLFEVKRIVAKSGHVVKEVENREA